MGIGNGPGPIIVLTASAGAGHNVAARALEEALHAEAPELEVEVLDVLDWSNPFFRRLYAQGYLSLVNHAPTAMGVLYEALDRPNQRWRDAIRTAFQNVNVGRTLRHLVQRRPRIVINTHFLPAEVVAQARRRGKLDCPQVTVTTDFETHRLWAQSPTERYFTATEEGKAYLCTWGVPASCVRVSGIPVRSAFEDPPRRDAVRAREGLALDRPLVLLLCGGLGMRPPEQLLLELQALPDDLQIVVVAGRNEKLRARLEAKASHDARRRTRVVGFTDRMHEWMAAADLVISKPGGLTVAESLVIGVPMVIVNPIPGQEARNSDYLLEHGASIKVNNPRLLGYRVGALLRDAERMGQLRAAVARLARPGAARAIVRDVLELIGRDASHTRTAPPGAPAPPSPGRAGASDLARSAADA